MYQSWCCAFKGQSLYEENVRICMEIWAITKRASEPIDSTISSDVRGYSKPCLETLHLCRTVLIGA